MSTAEEISWQDFGFPYPGFMPVWRPAEGLMKALAERELPFAETWDFDSIANEDQLPFFGEVANGQHWCREFDRRLKNVCTKYLNHLKLKDFPDVDFSTVMWTWEDLLLNSTSGEKNMIADPSKGDLSPEWNLFWLLQRYNAINLLLYAPVPFKYTMATGSVHTGEPSTPKEAYEEALKDCQDFEYTSGLPSCSIHYIYGPDHGWREGSYCCNLTNLKKVWCEFPAAQESVDNVFLVMYIVNADGSGDPLKGDEDVTAGYNIFTAGSDGVFFDWTSKNMSSAAEKPTRDHETFSGWKTTVCQAYADYTQNFRFIDKDLSNENIL